MTAYDRKNPKEERVQDTIVRLAARGKLADFRNSLIPAYPCHYAMLQGIGGSDFAPNSTIKFCITDYGKGGKNDTVFVRFNVAPEMFDIWDSVALRNLGEEHNCAEQICAGMTVVDEHIDSVKAAIFKTLKGGISACAAALTGSTEKSPYICLGAALKEARDISAGKPIVLEDGTEKPSASGMLFQAGFPYVEYSWEQVKTNPYTRDSSGLAGFSQMTVKRTQFAKDGSAMGLPWTLTVKNGMAPLIQHENGTNSYDSRKAVDEKEAFINISDADMHRACYRVNHFIGVWEMAVCVNLVRDGLKMRAADPEQ